MPKDYGRDAHNKGEKDSTKSRGRDWSVFGNNYNPPSGREKEYRKGWDNNQSQKKK
jgi:hypothetical protein